MSQIGDALQVLLERKAEDLMTPRALLKLAERLLEAMRITQGRNRNSRESHRRRRVKELEKQDIQCAELHCCDSIEVAL